MLRRKDRLMRRGRVEEASALAQRIGKEITRRTKTQWNQSRETLTAGRCGLVSVGLLERNPTMTMLKALALNL